MEATSLLAGPNVDDGMEDPSSKVDVALREDIDTEAHPAAGGSAATPSCTVVSSVVEAPAVVVAAEPAPLGLESSHTSFT